MTEDNKMVVYLAGPIVGCSNEERAGWRERAKKELPDIRFLDPLRHEYQYVEDPELWANHHMEIVDNDKQDIRDSDMVLVYHDRPSIGTAMEIIYAYGLGVYVLTIDATDKPLSPWIIYHSDKIVKTLDEALKVLNEFYEDFSSREEYDWEEFE